MTDHSLGQAVPILGISLNPDTGEVEPVGGRAADGYEVVVSGERFSEPLSGLQLFTCGGFCFLEAFRFLFWRKFCLFSINFTAFL